ncbi:MAG TPA: hypothetical protein DCP90_09045 [Clostridiales bacterium]|nr:MAG: hypothetical protein A2Y22_02815 [Clostridiales bacterium GWD2_32_59]HAN10740.1 hypothetical protein [Clostridiales bacterium]
MKKEIGFLTFVLASLVFVSKGEEFLDDLREKHRITEESKKKRLIDIKMPDGKMGTLVIENNTNVGKDNISIILDEENGQKTTYYPSYKDGQLRSEKMIIEYKGGKEEFEDKEIHEDTGKYFYEAYKEGIKVHLEKQGVGLPGLDNDEENVEDVETIGLQP